MSVKVPEYKNFIPQGALNKALWVGSVISDVFGISSPVYLPNAWIASDKKQPEGYDAKTESSATTLSEYPDFRLADDDESDIFSTFGTPVLGTIAFKGGRYNVYNKSTGAVEKRQYGDYTLPYSCIVEFSRESNVITTDVLGNTGTVKELFGLGDWNINIRGIALNDNGNASAHEQINRLIEWANINDAVNTEGDIFADKDIFAIVIKSIGIQPIEAKYNVIPFQIDAVSDEPLELTINNL